MPQSKSSTSAPKKRAAATKAAKAEKKAEPKLLRVRANAWYHNGTIAGGADWKEGEVREVSPQVLAQLKADAPGRWELLDA